MEKEVPVNSCRIGVELLVRLSTWLQLLLRAVAILSAEHWNVLSNIS